MVHIKHRTGIKTSIEKVIQAITTREGVAGWWTEDTTLKGNSMIVKFHSPEGDEIGSMHFEVKKPEVNKVQWIFSDGPEEWIGTDATFILKEEGEYTIVLFSHNNWREEVEFKSHCSMKWAVFLLSLKALLETGKGKPSPHDIKIDNWN